MPARNPESPFVSDDTGGAAARLLARNLAEHRRVFDAIEALREPICAAAATMAQALARGGRLLFFGNGGSASDSQHIAAELTGRLRSERRPLAAQALTADSAALTAIANDYGYAEVFARLLAAQARPGDVAIGLSTSGRSANVLRAFAAARALGVGTIALLGRDGGAARAAADLALVVPHEDSARIQEAHIFIGHTWCGQIEAALGLVAPVP
ncbi:MAG: SIS domain-containing protein [Rubrivivax sp.]|nr:SIS domain-containing protein [Rubrivivax sp.]